MSKKYIESNVIEYGDVDKLKGFTCIVRGETATCYYQKEFRFSTDNILWSDYRTLTNENLGKVRPVNNKVYIQYKFTQVGVGTLSVQKISLDVVNSSDTTSVIPDCFWTSVNSNRYSPQIVYNTNSQNLFNPYNIGIGQTLYSQMSTLVSNMFGFCVTYFKTEPNSRTRDVVLKEYSIEKVIDKQSVKILIPDNQLPTKELQFNSMMIDYPIQFEIHIVKSEFQSVFGDDSHPDPHDYIYFQTYMNKMYMVDSVSDPDDNWYTASYWRVSLVPYQELSSVKFDNTDLQEDTETLIFSAEGKFEEEVENEFMDNRKDNQLNDMGDWLEGQDFNRRYLDPNVRIIRQNIYNDWTVIADSYYDLSTIDKGQMVTEYKYKEGFTSDDERMISFLYQPQNTDGITDGIVINDVEKGDNGGIKLTVQKWNKIFEVGNVVKIVKSSNINGFRKIISVNKANRTIEVEGTFTNKTKIYNCGKLVGYELNNMFTIRNDESSVVEISQMYDQIVVTFNDQTLYYSFEDFLGFDKKWYCILLGLHNGMSNIWLYELSGSEKEENGKAKLKLIGKSSNDCGTFDFGDTCYYDIMACNAKLTNLRVWSKLCEEELHNIILSQLIVDDTHNTLIIDNAKSELLLNNKWS